MTHPAVYVTDTARTVLGFVDEYADELVSDDD